MKVLFLGVVLSFSAFAQLQSGQFQQAYQNKSSLEHLKVEIKCLNNEKRKVIRLNYEDGNNSRDGFHVGESTYGDISVIHRINGVAVLDLHICKREGAEIESASQLTNFKLDLSSKCPVDSINYGYARLGSNDGASFDIGFAPISIDGTNRKSALCVDQVGPEISDGERTDEVQEIRSSSSEDQRELSQAIQE